jgi:putative transcriptional regulator
MSRTPEEAHIPRHHPSDDLLLNYAAGRLAAVPSLVISTHLPFCTRCRDSVRIGETIGGALLSSMPREDMAPNALAGTLSRLDTPQSGVGAPDRANIELVPGVPLPRSLHGLVRSDWRWLAPGISRISIGVSGRNAEERVYLLRIAPGTRLPEHGHAGWEATCVLAGSFSDSTGVYGPGDVAEADAAIMHQPVAGSEAACICLIVCHGRLRLHGILARLMQPFVGI